MTAPQHPDTQLVDRLTAWLNSRQEVSGADTVEMLCELIAASGRPLLTHTCQLDAYVAEHRYGIPTGVVNADDYTVRVTQPEDGLADILIEVTTEDGGDFGLAITVNGRQILGAMPCTWQSTVPADLQLTPQAPTRNRP